MAPKPFITTGVALASAALIVAGMPALLSAGDTTVAASAPAPTKLSSAQYELTAVSDITLEGLTDAYYNGWGGYIGGGLDPDVAVPANADGSPSIVSDPYFPGINGAVVKTRNAAGLPTSYVYNQNPVYVTGIPGATYYLLSNALDDGGIVFPDGLYHYFYEVSAAGGAALPAVLYVATSEIFGADSPITQLVSTVFIDGTVPTIQGTLIGLASLTPTTNIGPVIVGGGRLASLYFTGATNDGDPLTGVDPSYDYGSPGLPAISGYIAASFAVAAEPEAPDAALAAPKTAKVEEVAADTTDTETVTTPKVTKNPLAELSKKFEPKKLGSDAGNPFKAVANALSGKGAAASDDSADAAKPSSDSGSASGSKTTHKKTKSSDD